VKEETLRLLEEDREFRYAVAGYLGLSEIMRRLEKHDEKFNEIVAKLKAHDEKFNEIVAKLKAHDEKFNEIAARLEKHDEKFNEIVAKLKAHDEKFNEFALEFREIRAFMERTSLTLEEEAREVVAGRLRREGYDVELRELVLPELEVNLYRCAGELCVVGEATTRLGVRLLRALDEKVEELSSKRPELLRKNLLKVVYAMWVSPEAVEEAEKRGIWVLKTTVEVTSMKIKPCGK